MTVIEKVARALASARGANPDECVHGHGWAASEAGKAEAGSVCYRRRWQDFEPEARAALEALREPSEVMLAAVIPEPTHLYNEGARGDEYQRQMKAAVAVERAILAHRWNEMLAAALNEPAS